MASVGHLVVGAAAARLESGSVRPSWRSVLAWSALSMLPDADVAGLALGIPYEAPFGHRGASHSFAFAALVGLIAGLAASPLGLPRARTWILATAVVATHPLLDTLTDGGLGCALLWPFDLTRSFVPWRPIPVSPLGLQYLSPYGAWVAAAEIILFGPLLFFALRRGTPGTTRRGWRPAMLAAWVALVWLIGSSDPIRQSVVGLALRGDTEYASGFSEARFTSIAAGMPDTDVRALLGAPLAEWLDYGDGTSKTCRVVRLIDGRVVRWPNFDRCAPPGIQPGMSSQDVARLLGPPASAIWEYSRSRNDRWFQARAVFFRRGAVEETLRRWVPDDD